MSKQRPFVVPPGQELETTLENAIKIGASIATKDGEIDSIKGPFVNRQTGEHVYLINYQPYEKDSK